MKRKINKRVLALAIAFIISFAGTVSMSGDVTKVAKAAEVTSGVTSDGIIWGGRGTVTETLTTGAKATVTLTESVIKIVVDSTTYPYFDTQSVGSVVIAKDDLLHIYCYSAQSKSKNKDTGNYYCMDLRNGNFIKACKNKSNNKYCLAMNANSYEVKGTSVLNSINTAIIDKEYFYENHYVTSGSPKKERLITRSEFEKIWNDKDPSEEMDPEPTVTPTVTPDVTPSANPTETATAKPSGEPTQKPTVTPSAEPMVTPSVTPSANPTATPMCGCVNGGLCACPEGTCVCVNCPCKDKPCKPTETPTATPNVTPSVKPTVTVPPMCNCVNGGPCIGPNGTCVCANCPYRDKVCNPTGTTLATAAMSTATTITSSAPSYKKVKPKVYYTSTMVGKRLKLWKVTQSVKNGKIKTSKKLMSICIFDKKKGTIDWNGYRRKGVKTCQFTKKKRWLMIITRKFKMKFYPSGKGTKSPKTMKGLFSAAKSSDNDGLVDTGVKKKSGKLKKLKY